MNLSSVVRFEKPITWGTPLRAVGKYRLQLLHYWKGSSLEAVQHIIDNTINFVLNTMYSTPEGSENGGLV